MKAVIFDLDGTLVDSADDLQSAANVMLAEISQLPLDRETIIGFIGHGVEVLVRRVLAHRGIAYTEAELKDRLASFMRYYSRDLVGQSQLFGGVGAMLDAVSAQGAVLGICTNKPEAPARSICKALGIEHQFTCIVGGDTLNVRKPDPAPLLRVLDGLGVSPQDALYVGDHEADYLTAQAAKVRFAFFEGGYQRTEIENFRPDFRIASMEEITEIVSRF